MIRLRFNHALFIGVMLLLATALGVADSGGGPPTSAPAPDRLDDLPGFEGMRKKWAGLMDDFDVPGMAIAVVKDGRIAAIETFGVRSPNGPAPTPDTIFYIASITKTYLAAAICALADESKLSLDDPVKKHLPRLKLAKGRGTNEDTITIRDLLCHAPGLGTGSPIVVLDAFTGEITEDRYYRWLEKEEPGDLGYSNVHFTLLGRVVEAVSGKPWREYLDQRIFKPAGLTRTTGYASRMYGDPDCAMPMERKGSRWQVCRLRKTDRTMHAAGGLGASVHDAARWLILHLNDGRIDGKRVISAGKTREMRRLQSRFPNKSGVIRIMEGFGLAWNVGTFHGTPFCAHGGGYAGTAAYYAMLPDKKCGFVILMNAGEAAAGLQDVIAVDILDRLVEGDERIDVADVYRKRVREQKKQLVARNSSRKAETSKPFKLSQPVNAYAGRFECPDLGTLTLAAVEKRLNVTMGECDLDVAPAGPDALRVLGPTMDGARFKFIVSPDGSVTAVDLDLSDETLRFKRVAEATPR